MLNKMDKLLFQKVCDEIVGQTQEQNGIGTLSEKTVHSVLKNYLSPDSLYHERKVAGFIADIYDGHEIIEIQTRDFNKLRRKLEAFLSLYSVTIVYPIHNIKYIRWINPQSGEINPPRKSPKNGSPYMVFPELYKIKNFLTNPNLKIRIISLNMEEYRYLDGWSQDKKKGSTRCDRIPLDIVNDILIENISDYQILIPDKMDDIFTSKDFKKSSKLSLSASQTALNILHYIGAVERIGKKGNSYLYRKLT